jgi:hypothetical protein
MAPQRPITVTSLARVPGYLISVDDILACTRSLPMVNAHRTYGTRRMFSPGIGYNGFKRLLGDNGIRVYVRYAFAGQASNKRKARDLVRAYDTALHPPPGSSPVRPARSGRSCETLKAS